MNKKGYSIIEMIVCIAILAILASGAIGLSGHLRLANVEKCAKEINSYLEKSRMTTMSKSGKPFVYIYKTDAGIFYKLSDETVLTKKDGQKVGGGSIQIYAVKKDGTEEKLTTANEIKIQFTKDTGAFSSLGGLEVYESIKVTSSKGSKKYEIKLVEKTGRHYIK